MITLLPIAALYVFGGATLQDFAFAIIVGITVGAVGTIFVATPLLATLLERDPAYAARRDEDAVPQRRLPARVEPVARRAEELRLQPTPERRARSRLTKGPRLVSSRSRPRYSDRDEDAESGGWPPSRRLGPTCRREPYACRGGAGLGVSECGGSGGVGLCSVAGGGVGTGSGGDGVDTGGAIVTARSRVAAEEAVAEVVAVEAEAAR